MDFGIRLLARAPDYQRTSAEHHAKNGTMRLANWCSASDQAGMFVPFLAGDDGHKEPWKPSIRNLEDRVLLFRQRPKLMIDHV